MYVYVSLSVAAEVTALTASSFYLPRHEGQSLPAVSEASSALSLRDKQHTQLLGTSPVP